MMNTYKRWGFYARCHLANILVRIGIAVLPAGRARDETTAIFKAYRAGVEATVFLHALNRLSFFTAEAAPDDLVETITAMRQGRFNGESVP